MNSEAFSRAVDLFPCCVSALQSYSTVAVGKTLQCRAPQLGLGEDLVLIRHSLLGILFLKEQLCARCAGWLGSASGRVCWPGSVQALGVSSVARGAPFTASLQPFNKWVLKRAQENGSAACVAVGSG